uniref:Lipase domain-containing protein n=1 Tax=Heliothis virescens TaxID=7102 RepID=A0A2A4J1M9_HELVI
MTCECQRPASLPLSPMSFKQIVRGFTSVPGRMPVVADVIIRHYSANQTSPTSYRIGSIKSVLSDPDFDVKRPTVLYAHGYVEVSTDESITTVMDAYLQRGGYNVLLLDWSNLAFGNYVIIAKTLPIAGEAVGRAVLRLLKSGLQVKSLHLVGHSLGSHLSAYVARYLSSKGFTVPRLTGLDPAYPGFYPALAAPPMSSSDAAFVDVIHTDGGGFGTPESTGHADFWPNGGQAKQPGCLSATIPLTVEDFCSHWRSWTFWAESLTSDAFLARKCEDYDTFLRGQCNDEPVVLMGLGATPDLRGNFYLRTGAKSPYGLDMIGAS